jgi:hypothetical protein
MERITYKAADTQGSNSCGHAHRTAEAAGRCLPKMLAQPHAAGAVIRVVRYHNGIQS